MMKFKSLFRRGQQTHQVNHPGAGAGGQGPLRQASSASSLEGKPAAVSRATKGGPGSGGGGNKAARMQELEREVEALQRDRATLEASLQEATTTAHQLHQLRLELTSTKVSYEQTPIISHNQYRYRCKLMRVHQAYRALQRGALTIIVSSNSITRPVNKQNLKQFYPSIT